MSKTLSEVVAEINSLILEAENIAQETGQSFRLSPAYGMGGTYDPEEENEDTGDYWWPSSLNC